MYRFLLRVGAWLRRTCSGLPPVHARTRFPGRDDFCWRDEDIVNKLDKLQWFSELYLYSAQVTDAAMKDVAKLKNLEILTIQGAAVTDAGAKDLTQLENLLSLDLIGAELSDVGAMALAQLPNLKLLKLSGTKITDSGRATLKDALPGCQVF
jgi:Leucine-rich repeat (LRR) protein